MPASLELFAGSGLAGQWEALITDPAKRVGKWLPILPAFFADRVEKG
ncbi:MAG: hypothetical protein P4L40_00260 [Terracidiphilus sp.]|nr:hypothetical protein [Terracidiphilus sp.]